VGRRARVNFRARIPLSGLQIRIRSQPARDWPLYLFIAWEILTSEMGLSDTKARSIILKSVAAAHRCVTAQNDQLSDIARNQAQKRIRIACSRIPNCINRAPAALRRRIDQAILPLIKEPIDFEALESIFETARKIFEPFQDNKPLRAALESLKKVHLSTLSTTSQDKVLKAIAGFKAENNANRTAARLFTTIGAALSGEIATRPSPQISNLIVRYVEELAAIWRHAELKPSRAQSYLNLTTYTSKFHQFAELILISGPWAQQYSANSIGANPKGRHSHADRPHELAPWTIAASQGLKYNWLVSDNHLKRALQR
jgi:hypothetical protein